MENQIEVQEGLTFAEIFRLLKKGVVVLLVSLIIGVILCTSVLLVLREFIGTTSYETEITFSSASISEDKEYNPSTAVNTLIKSDTVVSKALDNMNFSAEEQKDIMDKGLISKLSAYANVSKEDATGVSYPYKVTLSLKKLDSRTLSKAQSAALIEEITKQVMLELESEYKYDIRFDKISDIDYTQYNYLQVYDKLDNAMDNAYAFKSSLTKDALEYKKNGISIKATLEKYDSISSELNVIKQKLINNAITNPAASSAEADYAIYNANYYSQRATQLETRITAYATLLENTKPDITVTATGTTFEALDAYYELVAVYNELQDEYEKVSVKAQEWTAIKDAYSGITTENPVVESQYAAVILAYNSTYDSLSELVESYNSDHYASNLVAESKTVKTVKDSAISPLVIILVDLVVIAIIMIVVVAIEKKKEGKK